MAHTDALSGWAFRGEVEVALVNSLTRRLQACAIADEPFAAEWKP